MNGHLNVLNNCVDDYTMCRLSEVWLAFICYENKFYT